MQLHTHKFPSGVDEEMAIFAVPVEKIAASIGAEIDVWEEDGWGTARGFFWQLPNQRVILLRQVDHSRDHYGVPGPDLVVDALDALNLEFDEFMDATLHSLKLSREDIYRQPDDINKWRQHIRDYLVRINRL